MENEWQELNTVPRNCSWFEGLQSNGEVVKCHYAKDLSGEEQPPFEGFFIDCGSYYREVEIVKWRKILE